MLENVKNFVNKKEKPFIFHFNEYIMNIQDTLIDKEMTFLIRNNKIDLKLLSMLLDDDYR